MFNDAAQRTRGRMLKPWAFRGYLLSRLPLALAAGLRLLRLDDEACTVSLPGGWRTRNPFGSTYFAAQIMAAEMSTGAPAMVLASGAPASVAFILREVRGVFLTRVEGPSWYTFVDLGGMQATLDRAATSGESELYVGRSAGRSADGTLVSEFDVTWSFKRRKAS